MYIRTVAHPLSSQLHPVAGSYWKPAALTVNQCGCPVKPAQPNLGSDKSNSPSLRYEDLFRQTLECYLLRYENECCYCHWSQSIFSDWTENEKRSVPVGLSVTSCTVLQSPHYHKQLCSKKSLLTNSDFCCYGPEQHFIIIIPTEKF